MVIVLPSQIEVKEQHQFNQKLHLKKQLKLSLEVSKALYHYYMIRKPNRWELSWDIDDEDISHRYDTITNNNPYDIISNQDPNQRSYNHKHTIDRYS